MTNMFFGIKITLYSKGTVEGGKMVLAPDEIKIKLEEVYDAVKTTLEDVRGTDTESVWQDVALYIRDAIAVLDFIERMKRELKPNSDLLVSIERE